MHMYRWLAFVGWTGESLFGVQVGYKRCKQLVLEVTNGSMKDACHEDQIRGHFHVVQG